jgi:RNA polymerase sigma-70 factor (ECF subfamily)
MYTTSVSLLQRLRQPAPHKDWARFVALYTSLLFSWARRLGLQDQDAADLVQEVFAVLVVKLPEFAYDAGKSFRAWLRTVTVNKWREMHRRAAQPVAGRLPDDMDDPAVPDPAQTFWDTEYQQQLTARALQLMQSDFKPVTWKACWEVVANERPAAEVAAELGLTVGAVHAARFRVLTRLRQELQGLTD